MILLSESLMNKLKKYIFTFFITFSFSSLYAQNQLFDPNQKWILSNNKIEKESIEFIPYDTAKIEINTLILTFKPKGIIEYDYESPNDVDACFGVDYLDIDTEISRWDFDATKNVLTLTIKGGYASLDDFKFKRDYEIWLESSGNYVLRQTKEHFFIDLQKQAKSLMKQEAKKKKMN
jgi:hypothetical protein